MEWIDINRQDHNTIFYQAGGTLEIHVESYVERQADKDLFTGLSEGKFCYVLTSRQVGKSSLGAHVIDRLRKQGTAVAMVEVSGIDKDGTVDEWYWGLLTKIGDRLNLTDELDDFWAANTRLHPQQRFLQGIRKVILAHCKSKVVIVLDEIENVRSLPFSTDGLFAGIRELFNSRAHDSELTRLTFCLIGSATPSDLIQDTHTTPFNIGRRIEVTDFTEPEALPLAKGLRREEKLSAKMLGRILYWTAGHPYLTQRFCEEVAKDTTVTDTDGVDNVCEALFLSPGATERDDNLVFVRDRILEEEDRAGLLSLYGQIYRRKSVPNDYTNRLVDILRLSGITKVEDGHLKIRNRIYEKVFNQIWIRQNIPNAEKLRQQAAYRRGVLRATGYAAAVLLLIGGLAVYAFTLRNEAERQKKIAEVEALRADIKAKEAEALLDEVSKEKEATNQAFVEAVKARKETEKQKSIADYQRKVALEQKRIAVAKATEADQERHIAEAKAIEAEEQRGIAVTKAAEAERLSVLAVERQKLAEQSRAEAEHHQLLLVEQKKYVDQADSGYWENIKGEVNQEFYWAYLRVFPKGRHAAEARKRVGSLIPELALSTIIDTGKVSIIGRVYDLENFTPIIGATVIARNNQTSAEFTVVTSEQGAYLISVPPGSYTISITREGYEGDVNKDVNILPSERNVTQPIPGLLRRIR